MVYIMSEFEIYLILKLNHLIAIFGVFTALSVATIIGYFVYWMVTSEDIWDTSDKTVFKEEQEPKRKKLFWRRFKVFLPIALICLVFALAIPTTKDFIIIKVAPQVINNKQVQELPDNLLKFINGWIKDNTSEQEKEK